MVHSRVQWLGKEWGVYHGKWPTAKLELGPGSHVNSRQNHRIKVNFPYSIHCRKAEINMHASRGNSLRPEKKRAWAANEIASPAATRNRNVRHQSQVRASFLRTSRVRGKWWHLRPTLDRQSNWSPLMKLDSQRTTTTRKVVTNEKSLPFPGTQLGIWDHGLALTLFVWSEESEIEKLH